MCWWSATAFHRVVIGVGEDDGLMRRTSAQLLGIGRGVNEKGVTYLLVTFLSRGNAEKTADHDGLLPSSISPYVALRRLGLRTLGRRRKSYCSSWQDSREQRHRRRHQYGKGKHNDVVFVTASRNSSCLRWSSSNSSDDFIG